MATAFAFLHELTLSRSNRPNSSAAGMQIALRKALAPSTDVFVTELTALVFFYPRPSAGKAPVFGFGRHVPGAGVGFRCRSLVAPGLPPYPTTPRCFLALLGRRFLNAPGASPLLPVGTPPDSMRRRVKKLHPYTTAPAQAWTDHFGLLSDARDGTTRQTTKMRAYC